VYTQWNVDRIREKANVGSLIVNAAVKGHFITIDASENDFLARLSLPSLLSVDE